MRHKRRRRLRQQRQKHWVVVRMLTSRWCRFRRVHLAMMTYRAMVTGKLETSSWFVLRDGNGRATQLAGRHPLAKPYGDP